MDLQVLGELAQSLAIPLIVIAVCAYLFGCFNGAVIVSKYILRDDVRTHGSGNAGLTNFYRTFGGPWTFLVILTDILKAVFAVLLAEFIMKRLGGGDATLLILSKYWAGLFCILGHMYPCMFHFKGGKGILSGGIVAIMVDWRLALVVWGGFLLLTALTRWVSLGSLWAGTTFPIATWFLYENAVIFVISLVIGGLIVWKHRANIQRILAGTESKFSFHRKKTEEET
ncbi:MAG: glycerol-3-phosphate acyltransferase [Oscillibacter sp.]